MKKTSIKQLWPAIALFVILIVGITTRINLIETRDYWYDEAFTGITVRQDMTKMMEIIVGDVHPPLYYWLLKGWTMIGGSGIVSLRLFSVFFGVGTILLVFFALRMWFKKSWLPAVLGAFVFAINPFLANYSQEARMYTLLGFLILLASMLLTKAREEQTRGWRIAYSIVAACILLTHYLGFIFMVGFALYDFWQQYKTHPNLAKWKQNLNWLFSSYLIPFLAGISWIPFFLKQTARQNTLGWVPNARLADIPVSLHKFLFGSPVGVSGVPPALEYSVSWLSVGTISMVLLIVIVILGTYLTAERKWTPLLSFLGFMASFPLLLTWSLQFVEMQLYVERFLSGSAIFTLLFLIAAFYQTEKQAGLIGFVVAYTFLVVLIQPWQHTQSFEEITSIVSQRIDQEQIIFSSPFDFTVARFYLGEDAKNQIKMYNINNPQQNLTDWAIIDEGDQIFELPTSSHTLVTPQPNDFEGYTTIANINQFAVLNK